MALKSDLTVHQIGSLEEASRHASHEVESLVQNQLEVIILKEAKLIRTKILVAKRKHRHK